MKSSRGRGDASQLQEEQDMHRWSHQLHGKAWIIKMGWYGGGSCLVMGLSCLAKHFVMGIGPLNDYLMADMGQGITERLPITQKHLRGLPRG